MLSTVNPTIASSRNSRFIEGRIERLHSAMRRTAQKFHRLNSDDMYQVIAEFIIAHPYFRNDYAALAFAKKCCINHARRADIRVRYVCPMPMFENDKGDLVDYHEIMPGPDASPEQILIAKEMLVEILANLSGIKRRVLELLMGGYKQHEIAKILGRQPSSICVHIRDIRDTAKMVGLAKRDN